MITSAPRLARATFTQFQSTQLPNLMQTTDDECAEVLTSRTLPLLALEYEFQALVSDLGLSLGKTKGNVFEHFRVDFKHFNCGGWEMSWPHGREGGAKTKRVTECVMNIFV